ncbi:MAG TPA: EF-hand domain-containing protein [Flavobacteriaceae bacterium]|nr:EF-hand domain-containing protein [Flavobacteriaceae bacterium]
MKKAENKLSNLWVVTLCAMFFTTMAMNAQNSVQNENKQINKAQRFIDLDANTDGFISKSEFQFSSFDKFDVDENGKLSRNEFRAMKHSIIRTQNNNGMGITPNRQDRNGNVEPGNRQGNGTGVCPYGNRSAKKKNCIKLKGQRNLL